jgi:hypothetical protein
MRTAIMAFILLSVAGIPIPAPADPGYTYIDVGYVNVNTDGVGAMAGWGIDGSVAMTRNVHIHGGHSQAEKGPLRLVVSGLSLGYSTPITTHTDLIARAGYGRAEVRVQGFGTFSDTGPLLSAGVRGRIRPAVELNGFVSHSDIGDALTELSVGGLLDISEQFSLFGNVGFSSDATSYWLGLRVSF